MGRKPKYPAPEGYRTCARCARTFPATAEFFYRKKNNWMTPCRQCHSREMNARQTGNRRALQHGAAVSINAEFHEDGGEHHVVMFSGGAGSWAEAKLVVQRYGRERTTLLFTDTRHEDTDLYRFLEDAAANLGLPVIRLADGRTPWEVFKDQGAIGNNRMPICSKVLKHDVSKGYLLAHHPPESTILHFGLDWMEIHRIERVRPRQRPYRVEALLAESLIPREEVFAWMEREGLKRPHLYDLQFGHNNCAGFCVRAGFGHYEHLLKVDRDRYLRFEQDEEDTRQFLDKDVAILYDREAAAPITLRALRERLEGGRELTLLQSADVGGCGCFLDD